jgi:DNA-binding beta-propeller fold protein YncE
MHLFARLTSSLVLIAVSLIACGASYPDSTYPAGLDGRLFVVSKSTNAVGVINLATGETEHTIATGNGPHELIASDDGKVIVVSDYAGGDSLTVIDGTELKVVRTIDLTEHPRPHGIEFLPGDERIAVTSEASKSVVIINVGNGTIVERFDIAQSGAHMLATTADGRTLYTSNIQSNTVTRVSVADGHTSGHFRVPDEPEAIATTNDGKEVWVGSNATGKLSVLTPDNGGVRTIAGDFGWPYRILLTPDETRVVVPDLMKSVIRVFSRETGEELGAVSLPDSFPQGVTFYEDPRILFVSMNGQDRIAVVDIEAMRVIGTYRSVPRPDGIAYLPQEK